MNKADALAHIDAKAGAVRSKYITVAPGQEITYMLKSTQASLFKSGGYVGTPPPMIQAEMGATGRTAQQAADAVLTEEAQWQGLAAVLEGIRRSGKVAVNAATTEEEVRVVTEATIQQFMAYMP